MDQNSTNGTDKRNWRERLGIGAKEMPRISEEFKPAEAAPKAAIAPVVKPAPMAPRAAPRASTSITGDRAASMDTDALASKLKSQRDAAEKLAEQRVQAARQRAEASIVTAAPVVNGDGKPKFSFADEAKPEPVATPQRTQAVPPPPLRPSVMPPQAAAPQMAPPRPQLGGSVPPPRSPQPQYQQRSVLPPPPPPSPAAYPPAYAPNPSAGYRPIDPATGYAQPPNFGGGYVPQTRPSYTPQPRLNTPGRGPEFVPSTGYGYDQQRAGPRLGAASPARAPVPHGYGEQESDDIFEQPAPRVQRRATATDYQQAYREVESGFEDEAPRSRGPWLWLLGLLLMALIATGVVVGYNMYIKPQTASTNAANVPVVPASDQPAKVPADAATNAGDGQPATDGQAASPSKKQIYDRIVGDREVLGGQMTPTEETPVQPDVNTQPIPAPDAQAQPATNGTGDDGTPLPLPPPPGDNGQQGSLEPSAKGDQQDATITPAAGASQAAESSLAVATPPPPQAPASGEQVVADAPAAAAEPDKLTISNTDGSGLAAPEPEQAKAPVDTGVSKKLAVEKPAQVKKIVESKPAKSLGSKPVVLVPPTKKVAAPQVDQVPAAAANAGTSLYGDTAVGENAVAPPPVETPPVKKRKSLFDLFKGDSQTAETVAPLADPVVPTQPQVPKPVAPAQKVAIADPAPAAPAGTGYVAQLASFKSQAEAAQEYKNLSAKHGPIISRYAPIITEAQVAGSTRYRLSIGTMASADVATGVCKSLFAAGERDCLVHRQ